MPLLALLKRHGNKGYHVSPDPDYPPLYSMYSFRQIPNLNHCVTIIHTVWDNFLFWHFPALTFSVSYALISAPLFLIPKQRQGNKHSWTFLIESIKFCIQVTRELAQTIRTTKANNNVRINCELRIANYIAYTTMIATLLCKQIIYNIELFSYRSISYIAS